MAKSLTVVFWEHSSITPSVLEAKTSLVALGDPVSVLVCNIVVGKGLHTMVMPAEDQLLVYFIENGCLLL